MLTRIWALAEKSASLPEVKTSKDGAIESKENSTSTLSSDLFRSITAYHVSGVDIHSVPADIECSFHMALAHELG